jgi:hypothetical protein
MVFTLIARLVTTSIRGVEGRSDETYQNHLMVFVSAAGRRKAWW